MYTIIEDCSPFYIRFTHDGLDKIINICKHGMENIELQGSFTHYKFPEEIRQKILSTTPLPVVEITVLSKSIYQ